MHVALTGATGFIGSHVLTELRDHGHEVTALVRDEEQADIVAARGATPVVVDLYDRPAVVDMLRGADAAIHMASPGDATSADLDAAVADAAIEAFDGTGKPYVHISGLWVYGNNAAITEESPAIRLRWSPGGNRSIAGSRRRRDARRRDRVRRGLRRRRWRRSRSAARLTPRRGGQPDHARLWAAALGNGPCRRPGAVFRRVLESDTARGFYVVADGSNPTVAEVTEAAAVAAGAPGAVPGSDDEARARLGDYFAEVLLLDQGASSARARAELDWHPSHPALADEFRTGSYRTVTAAP